MRQALLSVTIAMLFCQVAPALAQLQTAICGEPRGHTISFINGKFDQGPDAISGATMSYSWSSDSKEATIITRHTASMGGAPLSYPARVISLSKRQIAFLVIFDGAIEVHSLFLDSKFVYFTSHKDLDDMAPQAASGKIFVARCQIGAGK